MNWEHWIDKGFRIKSRQTQKKKNRVSAASAFPMPWRTLYSNVASKILQQMRQNTGEKVTSVTKSASSISTITKLKIKNRQLRLKTKSSQLPRIRHIMLYLYDQASPSPQVPELNH